MEVSETAVCIELATIVLTKHCNHYTCVVHHRNGARRPDRLKDSQRPYSIESPTTSIPNHGRFYTKLNKFRRLVGC